MMAKRLLILIGLPGCGKSTVRQEIIDNAPGVPVTVISSDDFVDMIAKDWNVTYNDVFQDKDALDQIMFLTDLTFYTAVNNEQTIIVDRTNMYANSRAKYVQYAYERGYTVDALVVERPYTDAEHDEWNRRLDRPGKTIPNDVLISMFTSYEEPTKQEGFSDIMYENTFKD